MPIEIAVEININILGKMIEAINSLPHKEIIKFCLNPANNRGKLGKILLDDLYK